MRNISIDIDKSYVFPDSYAQLTFTQNGANSLITSSNLDPIFQPPLETPGIQKQKSSLQPDVSYNSAEAVPPPCCETTKQYLKNNGTSAVNPRHVGERRIDVKH